ncbi:MAG: hypothetical protein V4729_07075 [Pseudomonadota bacterium]
MTRKVLTLGGLCAALLLSGCGSDSSSGDGAPGASVPPPTTTAPAGAQGTWRGTINSPTPNSRLLEAIVLDDGTLWMAYSTASDPSQTDALINAAGIIKGQGTPDEAGSILNVSNARQLSMEDNKRAGVDVATSFMTGSSLTGTITRDEGHGTTLLPSPAEFTSLYRTAYNNNLTLAHLAGTYQGSVTSGTGKRSATLTLDAEGGLTGNDNRGCSVTGSATPRSRGNVFDLAIAWGSEGGCGADAGTALTGVVSLEANRVGTMASDADMKKAFVFVGFR